MFFCCYCWVFFVRGIVCARDDAEHPRYTNQCPQLSPNLFSCLLFQPILPCIINFSGALALIPAGKLNSELVRLKSSKHKTLVLEGAKVKKKEAEVTNVFHLLIIECCAECVMEQSCSVADEVKMKQVTQPLISSNNVCLFVVVVVVAFLSRRGFEPHLQWRPQFVESN